MTMKAKSKSKSGARAKARSRSTLHQKAKDMANEEKSMDDPEIRFAEEEL
jgi:hypothetical protein